MASRNDRSPRASGSRPASSRSRGGAGAYPRASRDTRSTRQTRSGASDFASRGSGSGRRGGQGSSREVRVTSTRVGDIYQTRQRASRPKAQTSALAKIVGIAVFLAMLLVGGIVLYFSNLFTIHNVRVEGCEHLTSAEMGQLSEIPADTTLLRIDTKAIRDNIMRDSWVADVDIHREFPDTLVLVVTERQIGATVVVSTDEGKATETWALASDGMWLCRIPTPDSEAAKSISPKIFEDAEAVFTIRDVAYGLKPEVGTYCTDESVNNALAIVTGFTTELKDQVKIVSASSAENTTLILDNNVEIAFGTAEKIRDKERVCLEIMKENPSVSYINVRVVSNPTWRSV